MASIASAVTLTIFALGNRPLVGGDTDAVIADYEKSTRLLAPYADYLVVNVSSPNTPGLRDLQAVEKLEPLLEAVRRQADAVTERRVPLLVKIAPDLSDDDVLAGVGAAHAAVDDAVGAVRAGHGPKLAGFANAVLRRLSEAGLEGGVAFIGIVPTGTEVTHVMAVKFNGEVLGTHELP